MAQSMDGAIKNYISVLTEKLKQAAYKVAVVEELVDVGNKSQLHISIGALVEESGFGQTKRTQSLALTLSVIKSRKTAIDVSFLQRIINDTSKLDRRRNENAQTTTMTDWTPGEDDGRNIVIVTATADIRTTEPCKGA